MIPIFFNNSFILVAKSLYVKFQPSRLPRNDIFIINPIKFGAGVGDHSGDPNLFLPISFS